MDIFSVYSGWGMWFLQFAVGVVFMYHGWPKMKNMKKFFTIGGGLHGLVEFFGGLALMLGFHIRSTGLVLAVIMLGAIYFKKFKWKTPFSSQNTTGWEFDLVLLAATLYFLVH